MKFTPDILLPTDPELDRLMAELHAKVEYPIRVAAEHGIAMRVKDQWISPDHPNILNVTYEPVAMPPNAKE